MNNKQRARVGAASVCGTNLHSSTPYQQAWVTDSAWITGVVGVIAILGGGYLYGTMEVKPEPTRFLGVGIDKSIYVGALATLAFTSVVMIVAELIRLWRFPGFAFITPHPDIQNGRWGRIIQEAIKRYCLLAVLFFICRFAYHGAGEYGFQRNHPYYQLWFTTLDILFRLYLIGGLPYILVTLAYKHNPALDKKDYAIFMEKTLRVVWSWLKPKQVHLQYSEDDKRCFRGLLVKLFFAPVITVFFLDNFQPLQSNFSFLFGRALPELMAGTYDYGNLGNDLGNIIKTLIFVLDVGLAWCGYIISSRWVDNQTVSAEPTLLGWTVCLISYPPFRAITGWYLMTPGESLYLQIPSDFIKGVFGFLMLLSFFLYMLPTVWFGLRFSNLTHRGILRKGPYAVVRHPAYATKNIAWWLVGLPSIIYVGYIGSFSQALVFLVGLILGTCIYYLRAVTEERHLSQDPDYISYCEHVKYRFIPGVI